MFSDFRFAVRSLLRTPGFTTAALLTLALGIGANAAMFSVANAVLFRPLPYPVADRMVAMSDVSVTGGGGGFDEAGELNVSFANFEDWVRRNRTMEELAAFRFGLFSITESGAPEAILGATVGSSFFRVSGTAPRLGRAFTPEEDVLNPPRHIIVSDRIWRRRMGGRPDAVGQNLQVDGQAYTVIGVMGPDYVFPGVIPSGATVDVRTVEIWKPLRAGSDNDSRGNHNYFVLGLLREGVAMEQVRADFDRIARELEAEYPQDNTGLRVGITPLKDHWVAHIRPALLVLLGAIGCVLLVACANVANLILARGRGRDRELAVRAALGASPGRLARQLLSENLALSLLGGAAGLFIAWATIRGIVWLGPENLPRASAIRLDATGVLVTLGLSVLTALLTGLAPVLRGLGVSRRAGLAEGSRGSASGATARARQALTVLEVAMSLTLLVGAGLLFRSFERLSRVELGFRGDSVMTVATLLPLGRYDSPDKWRAFFRSVMDRLEADPSVTGVAAINVLPLSGFGESSSFSIEGRPPFPQGEEPSAAYRVTTYRYAELMGLTLVAGRWLTPADDSAKSIVISQGIARDFFPEGAVGQQIRVRDQVLTIVGVVGDVREFGPAQPAPYTTYVSMTEQAIPYGFFLVKTALEPVNAGLVLRQAVLAVDPEQPVINIRTMESYVGSTLGPRRFTAVLMAAFSLVALVLAVVGLYGVVAYLVSQRTREIGIRVALGASTGGVLRLVLGQGMKLAGAGVLLGLALSLVLNRAVSGLLVGVSAFDPVIYGGVAAALIVVAAIATILPARRAARVDPVTALRSE